MIKYLAEHNHWSPFAHTFLSFRIEAPIFVARQLVKHQIGLVWNEESRRYIDSSPTLHKIKSWKEKPKNSKQGSGDQIVIDNQLFNEVQAHNQNSLYLYDKLIKANVAPEQARSVLPLNTYTNWIWSGTLYAFARVCELRCALDTQAETRVVADQIDEICAEQFPKSWKYLR